MDETRKRARTGNKEVASAPATKAPQSPQSTDATAAATKIAELRAELEALKESHDVVVNELRAKVDALQAENESRKREIEGLTSALQWAYGVERIPGTHWFERGHSEEYADAMENLLSSMKESIMDLRMGTVSNDFGESINIDFDLLDEDASFIRADHDELLMPYWKELAAALRHWSEYHADGKCLEVETNQIELPNAVLDILRPAFEESRIKRVCFDNYRHNRDMAGFVKKVLQTNHFVTRLGFIGIKFSQEDVETLCDAIKSRNAEGQPIKGLALASCFEGGIDTRTLTTVLASTTSGSAKEVGLHLYGNGMSSREAAIIAEFLNSNPSLAYLWLDDNQFNNADAAVLASSLSNNTQLRSIWINKCRIQEDGRLAFLRAVFDVSSLSSCAASNHTCRVHGFEQDISVLNMKKQSTLNKWNKILAMLALSSEDSFINTALLRGVPVKLIPVMLDKFNYEWCTDDYHELTDVYL
ncbi:hypothetical protein THAOC_37736, partial [Thalassiosira oceanica]